MAFRIVESTSPLHARETIATVESFEAGLDYLAEFAAKNVRKVSILDSEMDPDGGGTVVLTDLRVFCIEPA